MSLVYGGGLLACTSCLLSGFAACTLILFSLVFRLQPGQPLEYKCIHVPLFCLKTFSSCHYISKWTHSFHSDGWGPPGSSFKDPTFTSSCQSSHVCLFFKHIKGTLTLGFCVEHFPSRHKCNLCFQICTFNVVWLIDLGVCLRSAPQRDLLSVSEESPLPHSLSFPLPAIYPAPGRVPSWKKLKYTLNE